MINLDDVDPDIDDRNSSILQKKRRYKHRIRVNFYTMRKNNYTNPEEENGKV